MVSILYQFSSVQFTQLCPTLWDPMDCSMPGFTVYHEHPELAQIHVHQDGDAIQPSHPLSSPSPPAFNLSQHCWEPAWGAPPMAKVMRKEAWHTQRRDQASGNPLFLSIYPQTKVLYGELSPITISLREGVNLQLLLIKISGHDKSVSTYELWRFSDLPDQAHPAACDCLQPPNCGRHGMF